MLFMILVVVRTFKIFIELSSFRASSDLAGIYRLYCYIVLNEYNFVRFLLQHADQLVDTQSLNCVSRVSSSCRAKKLSNRHRRR